MKTGRFARVKTSNKFLVLNFVPIVALLIVCSLIVTGCVQTGGAEVLEPKDAKEIESDLEELLTTVYCHCGCTRETIKVCVCGVAVGIEASFKDELTKGKSVEEIRTAYLEQYGPQFYAVMPAEGINVLAYIMPAVILVLIGGVVVIVLRRSTQALGTADAQANSESQVSDDAVKQVEAELERYKRKN